MIKASDGRFTGILYLKRKKEKERKEGGIYLTKKCLQVISIKHSKNRKYIKKFFSDNKIEKDA